MADITKCSTENCPLESTCYRKQAISNPYQQAYGNFPVVNNNCNFYMSDPNKQYLDPSCYTLVRSIKRENIDGTTDYGFTPM